MAVIMINTAVSSSFFVLGLIFAFLSVHSTFTVVSGTGVVPNVTFGLTLVGSSLGLFTTELTSQNAEREPMSLVILSLATMWMGTGLFHILPKAREIVLGNATDTLLDADAFLPGYGSFLLLFLINFLLLTASKSHRSISVLLFLSTTLMVFELLDIYTAIHGSFVIYVLLSLFCFFSFLSYANFRLSKHNSISPLDSVHHTSSRKNISQHQMHLLLLTGLSVVSFVVFAFRGFPITKPVSLFAWQIAAGIVMVLYGISTLRAKIRWFSADLILSGLFWFAVSAYYIVADFVNLRVTLSSPVAVVMCVTSLIMVFVRVPNNAISAIIFLCKFLVFISLTTDQSSFQSVAGWIGIVLSAYGFTAYLTHFLNFQTKIPVFENIANMPSFRAIKSKALICSRTLERKSSTADAMMGYSKYLNTDDLAFAANAIAALSLSWVESGEEALVLPWVLGFGGTVQFVLGFVAFSRGKTFESSFFIFSALFWSIWGTVRCTSADDISLSASLGCISFLLVSMLFVVLSCTLSKLWMVVTSLFSLVILSNWLILLKVSGIKVFGLITFSCYAISCLYAFVSLTLKHIYDHDVFPLGKPIVQISHLHTDGSKAFWAESRRATGVKAIAELMKDGNICGIPTDTVYVLVAACNRPEAVERAYNTKKQAEDRPMSLWISNFTQIQHAKDEFGDLLWDFMHEIWPSNISAVVNKGEWVKAFGLGDSARYIGRPDSIAMRIPDSSITCHLIDQTGPIAVTSANPTGEADTTHHLQVLAKLGLKNCDGILCDGPSPENAASTVVDCRNIKSGKIGFFRIGLTPKSTVLGIFDNVLKKHNMSDMQADSSGSNGGAGYLGIEGNQSSSLLHSRTTIGGQHIQDKGAKLNPIFVEK